MQIVVLELKILITIKLPRKVLQVLVTLYPTEVVCGKGRLWEYYLPIEQTTPELLTQVKIVSTNQKVTQVYLSKSYSSSMA